LSADVVEIFSTDHAFAALKKDGTVVGWGDEFSGGFRGKSGVNVASDVRTIRSTSGAFAALLNDGTVQTWGYWNHGGVPEGQAASALASGQVRDVFSSEFTFTALMNDGSIVAWGGDYSGGDLGDVSDELDEIYADDSIVNVVGNRNAFAAISKGGRVVSWGISAAGFEEVSSSLMSGVVDVVASDQAFAALKDDGSVVTWGSAVFGGDSSAVASELQQNVVEVVAASSAFAARRRDGSVVVWGDQSAGGDATSVQELIQGGVSKVYANDSAFSALKRDGTVVAWGDEESGGSTRFASGGDLVDIANISDVFTNEFIGSEFSSDEGLVDRSLIQQVIISASEASVILTSESRKKDKIIGTSLQDLFLNGLGADQFTGKGGSDIFWFDRPESFGKKHAEKILDFDLSFDVIIFGSGRFSSMDDEPDFVSVVGKKEFKKALRTNIDFIYESKKGRLFFNSNGDEPGAGDGGMFARLIGKPALTSDSLGFTI
jgi:hypothetical protein